MFTPEWRAIYDPITRNRWDAGALLNGGLTAALAAARRTPEQEAALRAAEIIAVQPYSTDDAEAWGNAGWSDALRHYLHTNLLPKLDYSIAAGWVEDFSTMREKVCADPPPPLTTSAKTSLGRFPATATPKKASFFAAATEDPNLSPKRSTTHTDLNTLLSTVFGVTGEKKLAITGAHVRKTSPSGGSRHPTEAYVCIFDIEELPRGVYHFDARRHELALLREANVRDEYMERVAGLNRRVSFVPKVAIVLSSVVERSMHRYRDSRSYRVLHLDVGHLLASTQLIARALGLPYFCAYSVGDSAAEALIGIDGLMETAMTQILLG